jgi:putative toxin-antitoxin system antitoxin component (TIGR02293 family)
VLRIGRIGTRTYRRRCFTGRALTHAESDRLLRIARVARETERVFSDSAKAQRWLTGHQPLLNAVPLDLLMTDLGADAVKDALTRIEFGEFT